MEKLFSSVKRKIKGWIIALFVLVLIYTLILIPLDNAFDHSFPSAQSIYKIWNNWFPNKEKIRIDCLLDEQRQNVISIFGYKQCLAENDVDIRNLDIRKVCYLQAKDEHSQYKFKSENEFYLDCVRSQGLPD